MCGDKSFSCLCHLNYILNTFFRSGTSMNLIPVEVALLCTFLTLGSPVIGISFEANDERECLGVLVIDLNSTAFN